MASHSSKYFQRELAVAREAQTVLTIRREVLGKSVLWNTPNMFLRLLAVTHNHDATIGRCLV